MLMEQRRASTTSQPQGAPQAWTHWTSRPSIAADEAMLRRMQERFGAPPPPPPPPPQPAQQPGPPLGGPPAQYLQQAPKLPHSMATFSMQTPQPQQQQRQAYYPPGGSTRLAPPAPGVAGKSPPPPQQFRPSTNTPGAEATQWKPPANSLGISSGAPPAGHLAPPPPPAGLRLPPLEFGPPRRHSLAVTSHLDRYRARDGSPQADNKPAKQGPRLPPPQGYTQPQQYLGPTSVAKPTVFSSPQSTSPPQPPPPMAGGGGLMRPTLPHLADTGELPALAVRVPDNHDQGDSRRGSVYSNEHVPETRRSSIIALTNHTPESLGELRAENAELRRRIDDMESRYMRETDQLKTVIKELRIEKSLLKSLLMEKGEVVSSPQMQSSASSPRPPGA
ncbi:hypothetical protein DL89DRAFT_257055 [Linderina pennispora]|uniref:Uncharacterized protein n=1 Tax=Linderina pennispora TaxID=61395 RepID=A0A1Y1WBG8_9FUNG|nr:uncharacterized protein DL89DRAFT_257055 [Linderina pennispora]ORX70881.1 hypothetical protein DL89DRAFT_257055 [Linderina pennispora]